MTVPSRAQLRSVQVREAAYVRRAKCCTSIVLLVKHLTDSVIKGAERSSFMLVFFEEQYTHLMNFCTLLR
jgi:hypothetical protein